MRYLVFGGSGFVGRCLVARLEASEAEVTVAGRSVAQGTSARTVYRACDLAEGAQVRSVYQESCPDVVINLAAPARDSADQMCRTNVLGIVNLVAAAREFAPGAQLVTFGSAAEYGNIPGTAPIEETAACAPMGVYGASKLAATHVALGMAHEWGMRLTVVRPFNIVGPGCPQTLLVGALIARVLVAAAGQAPHEVAVGRTDTKRDFICVDDVVDAVMGIVRCEAGLGVVNVCSGVPTAVAELLVMVARVSGVDVSWRIDPALVRPDDPQVSYGSHRKLTKLTGFEPRVSLEQSLIATWQHAVASVASARVTM